MAKAEKKKLKFAFYWAASCGGCEIAVLDIDEKILDVVEIA
jgi:F420-non-reducing hydrogenase small subunit